MKELKFLLFWCAFFLTGMQLNAQDFDVEKETTFSSTQVNNIDGATWCSAIATDDDGSIYWGYLSPGNEPNINMMIKKHDASTGLVSTHTILENISKDNNHAEVSIGIDNNGYIHVIGGQHNNAPNYYRSANPKDITSWVFKGDDDLNNGGLEGEHITYQHFFRSNNGTLFCAYRERLTNKWTQGEPAIMMARYNTSNQNWTMLGGQNFKYTDSGCNELRGGIEVNKTPLIWDDSGIGGYPDCAYPCDRNTAYQGYKLKVVFDKNNVMHVTWNLGKNYYTTANPAERHTHILYAKSPDEGNTWYRADGSQISTLPITCETGNSDQDGDVVFVRYPDKWPLGCENTSTQETIGNESYIFMDSYNQPVIECRPRDLDRVYMRWNGSTWEDATTTFSDLAEGTSNLYSNHDGYIFKLRSDVVYISKDNWTNVYQFNLTDATVDWNIFEDPYYLASTGKLRYYSHDQSTHQAQVITLSITEGVEPPPPPVTETIWLEAECGNVGSNWEEHNDANASNGKYMKVQPGLGSNSSAPAGTVDRIEYSFNLSSAGTYKVWLRSIAANGGDDSFWVKVPTATNNNSWIKYNNIPLGSNWEWDVVHDTDNGDNVVLFDLPSGSNTLYIAYREDETKVDKIVIATSSYTPPSTAGSDATNCGGGNPTTYTLTTSATNGDITLDPAGGTYDENTTVTATATADAGYYFTDWDGASEATTSPVDIVMDADKSLTANFSPILVSSISIPEGDQTKEVGNADFTLTKSVSPGDALDKSVTWSSSNESVATVTSGGVVSVVAAGTADITATANDASGESGSITVTVNEAPIPQYTLTTSATNGSISLSPTGGTYDENTTVTATATADAGYHFTGWQGASNATTTSVDIVMDSDKSLTANFAEDVEVTLPDPLAWYKFEGNGVDSQNAHDGVLQNSPSFSSDSKEGNQSIDLNGTDQWMKLSYTVFKNSFTARTVTAWIKVDNTSGLQNIYEEGGGKGFGMRINNGTLEARARDGYELDVSATFTSTSWKHVVARFNAGGLDLFIDGSLVSSDYNASFASVGYHSNEAGVGMRVGDDPFPETENAYFGGLIDDVRIYDVALTDDEVQAVYDENKSAKDFNTLSDSHGIKVYPNPANVSEDLIIELLGFENEAQATINIMDISGRLAFITNVQTRDIASQRVSMSLDGVSSGVYLVIVRGNDKQLMKRLIVK